jgi:hypothetical protein
MRGRDTEQDEALGSPQSITVYMYAYIINYAHVRQRKPDTCRQCQHRPGGTAKCGSKAGRKGQHRRTCQRYSVSMCQLRTNRRMISACHTQACNMSLCGISPCRCEAKVPMNLW